MSQRRQIYGKQIETDGNRKEREERVVFCKRGLKGAGKYGGRPVDLPLVRFCLPCMQLIKTPVFGNALLKDGGFVKIAKIGTGG